MHPERRRISGVLAALALWAQGTLAPPAAGAVPAAAPATLEQQRQRILTIVAEEKQTSHLRAMLVRVSVDGRDLVNQASGESMGGLPATTAMRFRNGAVAIAYVSTLLLRLADQKVVGLDDPVGRWLPALPNGDRVSLRQLARMTSGYADYVQNPEFVRAFYRNPFRSWTPRELIAFANPEQLLYEPGSNWNYAHTNYLILGLALEKATGEPMQALLRRQVLDPMGLRDTIASETAAIPAPVLHAFSSERRGELKIPAAVPFSEESTFWNPSWTLTRGAVQTTTLADLHTTAREIGSGRLLSTASYREMVSTDLRGRTTALPGCSTCFPQSVGYSYGMGLVTTGNWLTQNPLFGGYAASFGVLPSRRIAIAVAVTFKPAAFNQDGDVDNTADHLFRRIGAVLAPDDPPPMRPKR